MNTSVPQIVPAEADVSGGALLRVEHLSVAFGTSAAPLTAVEDVSFVVHPRETLAIVGESGCGKSVTAMALMGLLPPRQARITNGSIRLQGEELVGLPEPDYQMVRGERIAMIFQEPMTALNPVMSIGRQITEVIVRHRKVSLQDADIRALDLLSQVGIADGARRLCQYPHEFSGGMRQRVMIAMALACDPALLIADEPTTALDVTVQAQILDLIGEIQHHHGTAVVLITHDLGVVAEQADRALVMYAGRIVETGPVVDLLTAPRHPYTAGLIASIPRLGLNRRAGGARLNVIPGTVPPLGARGNGCTFASRCPLANSRCAAERPQLLNHSPVHAAACFRSHEVRTI
jgi:peptide/nickel transport system ATP-binding protein